MSDRPVVSAGCVPELSREQAPAELVPEQAQLLGDLLQQAVVLDGAPRQVWHHLVDGAVRHVLVHRVARLAEREADLVAHPQQLTEADHPVVRSDTQFLHPACTTVLCGL